MDLDKIYRTDFVFLDENIRIRRISVDGNYYYSAVDIQRACDMCQSRSQLRVTVYEQYSINVHINKNVRKSRFISEEGVKDLLSRSRYPKAYDILNKFLSPNVNKVVLSSDLYSRMDIKKTQDSFRALQNYIYNVIPHSDHSVTLQALIDNVEKELKNGGILK